MTILMHQLGAEVIYEQFHHRDQLMSQEIANIFKAYDIRGLVDL